MYFKKLLIFLFLCLSSSCYGQVYEPAILVTVFSDTISCQLKHIRYITTKSELRYKKSLDDKKDIFINVKDVLWIYTRKDTFECLTIDKGLDKGQVGVFRLLKDGHLRLYAKDQFTNSLGGDTSYTFFLKKEGKTLKEFSSLDYKKHLLDYTSDYPKAGEKINVLLFKLEDIGSFIAEYNAWHMEATGKP